MTEPSYLQAIRRAYDTVAVDYAELLRTELAAKPLDRAVLAAFAELVLARGVGLVADLGCGPGRVTAHLQSLGLKAVGCRPVAGDGCGGSAGASGPAVPRRVDDRPGPEGRRSRRHRRLVLHHSLSSGELALGVHRVPSGARPRRTAAAFQVGNERVHLERAYGHAVSLDTFRLSPDRICELLSQSGLVVHARLLREPEEPEKVQQCYLMARKPVG